MERGKPGSQAKHIETAEFKAKTKAEEYLSDIESSIEAACNKSIPKKKKAVEAKIENLWAENAVYKEQRYQGLV